MITFLFLLIILGTAIWVLEHSVPMDTPFRVAIRVVVVLFLLWYLLALLGYAPVVPRGRVLA